MHACGATKHNSDLVYSSSAQLGTTINQLITQIKQTQLRLRPGPLVALPAPGNLLTLPPAFLLLLLPPGCCPGSLSTNLSLLRIGGEAGGLCVAAAAGQAPQLALVLSD